MKTLTLAIILAASITNYYTNRINGYTNVDIGSKSYRWRMPGQIRTFYWETLVGTNIYTGSFSVKYTTPTNIIGIIVWRDETNFIYLKH